MSEKTSYVYSKLKLLHAKPCRESYLEFVNLAESGDLQALVVIGWFHEVGKFVPKSEEDALKYYNLAASKGCIDAYYALGNFYKRKELFEQSLENYLVAAQNRHLASAFNVGIIYERGLGVAKDVSYAAKWFEFSASENHIFSLVKISHNYRKTRNLKNIFFGYFILLKAMVLGFWFMCRNKYDGRILE